MAQPRNTRFRHRIGSEMARQNLCGTATTSAPWIESTFVVHGYAAKVVPTSRPREDGASFQ